MILLANPQGGFIPKWYSDPDGAGHSVEAVNTMCEEFVKICDNWQKEFS